MRRKRTVLVALFIVLLIAFAGAASAFSFTEWLHSIFGGTSQNTVGQTGKLIVQDPDPIVPVLYCPTGLMRCNGICTQVKTNPDNCGTCGHICSAPDCQQSTCINGACGTTNRPDGTVCAVPGAGGNPCQTSACSSGACQPTNVADGTVCGADSVCRAGNCVVTCGMHGMPACSGGRCTEGTMCPVGHPGEGSCWYDCNACSTEGASVTTSTGDHYACRAGSWSKYTPTCGTHGLPQCTSGTACTDSVACAKGTPGENYCWYDCNACLPDREGNVVVTSTGARYTCTNGVWKSTPTCGTHGLPQCTGGLSLCSEGTACAKGTPGENYCWYDCGACLPDREGNVVVTSTGDQYLCSGGRWIKQTAPTCGTHGLPQCTSGTACTDSVACAKGTPGENYCWYDCNACLPDREGNVVTTSTGARYTCTNGVWKSTPTCGTHGLPQCTGATPCAAGEGIACPKGSAGENYCWYDCSACLPDREGNVVVTSFGYRYTCTNGKWICSGTCTGHCAIDADCKTGEACVNNVCTQKTFCVPGTIKDVCAVGSCAGHQVCNDLGTAYSCVKDNPNCGGGLPCKSDCSQGGYQCKDQNIQQCQQSGDLCWYWTATPTTCTPPQTVCSNGQSTCTCVPQCGSKSCGAQDGCGGICQTGSCTNSSETCQAGKCTGSCPAPQCTLGTNVCTNTTAYQSCYQNATGCVVLNTTVTACATGNTCSGGTCTTTCNNQCNPGSAICSLTASGASATVGFRQTANVVLNDVLYIINYTQVAVPDPAPGTIAKSYFVINITRQTPYRSQSVGIESDQSTNIPSLNMTLKATGSTSNITVTIYPLYSSTSINKCIANDSGCYSYGSAIACDPGQVCDVGSCVPGCMNNDGVCPSGCTAQNDNDCAGSGPSNSCSDTDGGQNYNVAGITVACRGGNVAAGLVLNYSFDIDGHDGTAVDGAVWSPFVGHYGTGVYNFNGDLSAIAAGPIPAMNDYTYDVWIKVISYNSSGLVTDGKGTYFVDRMGPSAPLANLKAVGSQFVHQYRTDNNSGYMIGGVTGGAIVPGTWQHVVWGRKKGVELFIYVDGVKSTAADPVFNGSPASITPISPRIGSHALYPGEGLNGMIDEFRLYNRALSQQEVLALYTEGCQTRNDACINSTSLAEYYCNADNGISNVTHVCPTGCANGACIGGCTVNTDCASGICSDGVCISPTNSCADTDGGQIYGTPGTVTTCHQSNVVSGLFLNYNFDVNNADINTPDYTAVDGAVWSSNGGRYGSGAYSFNGNRSAIAVGSFPVLTDYTYEIWLKVNSYNGSGLATNGKGTYFVDRMTASIPLANLKVVGSQFVHQYRTDNNSGAILGGVVGGVVVNGTWQHIVWGRKKGVEMFIYVDGVKSTAADPVFNGSPASITPISPRIGSHALYSDEGLNGMVDEFRVYNRTLSYNDVMARYQEGCQRFNDTCGTAINVTEYFCNNDGGASNINHACPNGCANGACISCQPGTVSCGEGRDCISVCTGVATCDNNPCDGCSGTAPSCTQCNSDADCPVGNYCFNGHCGQPQCSDGIDNDGDGKIDFPADPGCAAPNDNSELDTSDYDGDSCSDSVDKFPTMYSPDSDGDGIHDDCDNCPYVINPDQKDTLGNGIGDACRQSCTANAQCGAGRICVNGNCTNITITPGCGNSVVETGEECDDGNAQSGDGCSSTCKLETSFCSATVFEQSYRFSLPTHRLALKEPIGNVTRVIGSQQMPTLLFGTISTAQASTTYTESLRFSTGADDLQPIIVDQTVNNNNVPGDYLVIDTAKPFMHWRVNFTQGLSSVLGSQSVYNSDQPLQDVITKSFPVMDQDWAIVYAAYRNSSKLVGFSLARNAIFGTQYIMNSTRYTINGINYTVVPIFMKPESAGIPEVKFTVNGETTQSLTENTKTTMSGGIKIGVIDIDTSSTNSSLWRVSFWLAPDVIDLSSQLNGTGIPLINSQMINEAVVSLSGHVSGGVFTLSSVDYYLTANAVSPGTTIYAAAGHGVREYMKHPQALLSPALDLRYNGLTGSAGTSPDVVLTLNYCSGTGAYCIDSDGLNLTNYGNVTFKLPSSAGSTNATIRYDYCFKITSFTNWSGQGVASCSGNNCFLNEQVCQGDSSGTMEYSCTQCSNGICTGATCAAPAQTCGTAGNFTCVQRCTGAAACDDNACNGCSPSAPSCGGTCGDGIVQPGEQCDGTNWGHIVNCSSFDKYTGGPLTCNPITCLFNVSQCTGGNSTPGFTCGNGVINSGEQCDNTTFGPVTGCSMFGTFTSGTLTCDKLCRFNTTQCQSPAVCGNGIVETGEQCDKGTANGGCPAECSDLCINNICGGGGSGGGGGGGGGSWGTASTCQIGFHREKGICVKDPVTPTPTPPKKEPVPTVPKPQPEISASYSNTMTVKPLTITNYDVTVVGTGDGTQDVTVDLAVPSDWQYSGPVNLGTIAAGESKIASFKIAVGCKSPKEENLRVSITTSNMGGKSDDVPVTVDLPQFIVKAMPRLTQYGSDEIIPVCELIYNSGSSSLQSLDVEVDVNKGSKTLNADYLSTFNLAPGERKVRMFNVPAYQVLGQSAQTVSFLRQRTTTIQTSNNPIPS